MFVFALVLIAALWEFYKVIGPEDGGSLLGINVLPRANGRAMPHVWDMLSRYNRPELRSSPRKIWRVVLAGAWFSFRLSLVGFAIGATVGVALATLMARFRVVERGLLPYLVVSQTVPLIALAPRLAATRSDLDRVLKQRNALLKTAQHAALRSTADVMRTLDAWDTQFAQLSAQIVIERLNVVDALLPYAQSLYAQVSDDRGPFEMRYECSLHDAPADRSESTWEARYLEALAERRNDEIERGITLVGPHRDELGFDVRNLPVKGYASHGESWSAALTLRLASFELLRHDRPGGDPVLILDDVFAELDSRRRRRLVELTQTAEQTLVTAAVAEDVPTELDGARFEVHAGEVHRVG